MSYYYSCYALVFHGANNATNRAKVADFLNGVVFRTDDPWSTIIGAPDAPGEFYHAAIRKVEDPALQTWLEQHPTGIEVDSEEPTDFRITTIPAGAANKATMLFWSGSYPSGNPVLVGAVMFRELRCNKFTVPLKISKERLGIGALIIFAISVLLALLWRDK